MEDKLIAYNVVLYPKPNYFRHFLVFAKDPIDAINKINYQARIALPIVEERYPNNIYGKRDKLISIIKASRRYKRWYKHKFACTHQSYAKVHEIPTRIAHEGQLYFGVHTESLIQNLLSDLLHPKVGNEQGIS